MRISGKYVVLGGGAYLCGVGVASYYAFAHPGKSCPCCQERSASAVAATHSAASVSEKRRLDAFSTGAGAYDKEISFDETVLGIGLMRRALLSYATGNVLEVACGTARNASLYDPTGVKKVLLTDPCAPMLEEGRKKLLQRRVVMVDKGEKGGVLGRQRAVGQAAVGDREVSTRLVTPRGGVPVELQVADAQSLPFEDNSFDTVVDTFGLCSMEDPVSALREMQRVCRPGGRILLLEHGRSPYEWLARMQDKSADKHAERWGCYFNKDIYGLIREAELKITSRFDWHFGTTNVIFAQAPRGDRRVAELP